MPTLTLKNVRKSFGGNDVLRGIDLEVTTARRGPASPRCCAA